MRSLALLLVLAACPRSGEKPKPKEPSGSGSAVASTGDAASAVTLPPAPPLPAVPHSLPPPPDNPHVTADAVALGELLFNDPRLSADGQRMCADCHDPLHDHSGRRHKAADGKENLRRAPALANLAWVKEFGWDGRYASVPDLLAPHLNGQLGNDLDTIAARIDAVPVYHAHIARIGGAPRDAIVQALEAFVLTRYDGDAPWDSQERIALSRPGSAAGDPVLAGYQVFMGKAQCGVCHPPPLYTDGRFHVVVANTLNDPGHKEDHAFRTPTLRGAARRKAYFHDGLIESLDAVVTHYATSAAKVAGADAVLGRIRISDEEQAQLVAFLRALTSDTPTPTKPVLP